MGTLSLLAAFLLLAFPARAHALRGTAEQLPAQDQPEPQDQVELLFEDQDQLGDEDQDEMLFEDQDQPGDEDQDEMLFEDQDQPGDEDQDEILFEDQDQPGDEDQDVAITFTGDGRLARETPEPKTVCRCPGTRHCNFPEKDYGKCKINRRKFKLCCR